MGPPKLKPPVVRPPKLKLDYIEEASGYQIHSNTELEEYRKVKSKEFEIGDAKFRFLQKTDIFCKIILLAPSMMGRAKLELDGVE